MNKKSAFSLFLTKGFTLLELVIVFTIMAIISTVGLASFVNYSNSQVLQQTKSDLINTLNLAKSNSFSQVKTTVCGANKVLDGYRVTVTTSANPQYYSLWIVCSGTDTLVSKTLLASKGVSFDASTTTQNVFFPVLTNGVVGAGNIVLKGSNDILNTITITQIGGIQ